MIGLRSNFGASLLGAAVAFAIAVVAAGVVARRRSAAGRPWLTEAARVLTVGAVVVVIVATALPRSLVVERGDLVLELGRAGLADWRSAFANPGSLPSLQLFSNALLYVPVGFGLAVGWVHRRRLAIPLCAGLSVGIETLQYFVLDRVAALDDVVLNVSGAIVGWLAGLLFVRIADRRVRHRHSAHS